MNPQDIIDSFFINDGQIQPQGSRQRSVLLALEKDLSFCILLPRVWTTPSSTIQLTTEQFRNLGNLLPTFTVVLLFCTSVDVLARVVNKRRPAVNQNGTFFRNCLQRWFGLNQSEARELWQLRNGVSHSYRLLGDHAAREFGDTRIIRQRSDGVWEFYLRAMYTGFGKAKRNIYDFLSNEPAINKNLTTTYLIENGFFYTR